MTMNLDPVFAKTQRTTGVKVSTDTAIAATDLDTTPTGTVKIPLNGVNNGAPADGCVVTKLIAHLVNPGLTTAAPLKLYLSKDNGTTMFLLKDILHAAIVMTNVLSAPDDTFGYSETDPLRLEEGDTIWIQARSSAVVADAFHVTAQYTELKQ